MTDPDLVAAVTPVLDLFERLGIPHYIGGSVASSVHGVARSSLDVDVVAEIRSQHVDPIVQALESTYYVDAAMIQEAIDHRSSFNLVHLATAVKVDVFVPPVGEWHSTALGRPTPEALDPGSPHRRYPIASVEDIVLHKLRWFRLGGEVSERQWSDVLGVLRMQRGRIDLDDLRRWARELGVEDLLDRVLAEV